MTIELQPVEILGDVIRKLDTDSTPIVGNVAIAAIGSMHVSPPRDWSILKKVAEHRFTDWSFDLDTGDFEGPCVMRIRSAGWEPIERKFNLRPEFPQEVRMFRDKGFVTLT